VEVQRSGPVAIEQKYAQHLRSQGKTEAEINRTRTPLRANAAAEIERWNQILTSGSARFNTEPNAFLVEMTRTLKPGRALDVGMGQGRNTLYLSQHGWEAEGFDPADRAVAAAQDQASKLGVKTHNAHRNS
jgi:2-polyprenyl-3-methyl-5-hydroxy-6-metoxy-1,4-benzoquinol methylase